MFEKLIRELKKLEGTREISITLRSDEDGFFDRACPADACQSEFKVLMEHWRSKVPDERAWCPFCGHSEAPQEFNTTAQLDHIRRAAVSEVQRVLHRGLRASASDFNRRQPRNSWFQMRMDVRSAAPQRPLPPAAAEIMRTEFVCSECECKYRVVGSAFFCPACGNNCADQTFDQTLARVRKSVDIYLELASTLNRDDAALLRTQLLEGGLSDLVTAFQHLAELKFPKLPAAAGVPLRRNVFQNLTAGSAAWASAGGRAFDAILNDEELADAKRLFQQRHILEHREGFVDETYLDRSGDPDYAVGNRLVIREAALRRFVTVIEKLARGLRSDAPG